MEGNLPVIVAVDGSVDSERALRWGREAARLQAAPLHVVHVWPYATAERAAAGQAGGDPVLARLRDEWEAAEGEPDPVFRSIGGLPDSALPALGAEARMLVLGSRGRGGFASLLLGSNGLAVAGQAACPVVIVPRPDRGGGRRAVSLSRASTAMRIQLATRLEPPWDRKGVVMPVSGMSRVTPPTITNTCSASMNDRPPASSFEYGSLIMSAVRIPRCTIRP